jgi:actin-related protein
MLRAANEAIQVNRHSPSDELLTFLCECSATDCLIDLELTLLEYTSVRSDNLHFAVASGHETTEIERVVDEFDRYTVVAKMPAG